MWYPLLQLTISNILTCYHWKTNNSTWGIWRNCQGDPVSGRQKREMKIREEIGMKLRIKIGTTIT